MKYKLERKDIVKIDIQTEEKTKKEFAMVHFMEKVDGNLYHKYAWVKDLQSKPADMDLKDWCLTVLNMHYLVREEELKRGPKSRLILPKGT